jgi:ribonuclease HII
MVELASLYPQYGFEGHKGYGSATHIEAIRQYGYCEIHRKTFKLKALQPSLF